jgi:tRNA(Ile)-lysidine synthase
MQVTARREAAPVVPVNPTPSAAPLADDAFAARMARLAPFEGAPAIAVAVSGGRDSMCLALLASRWAAAQGGNLVALIVDHGLRPEAASEARQVGDWLSGHGIRHCVLRWAGPHPASGIQAAARQARYRLLSDYCRDHAILHLLVGHHREDQAETVVIRGERASGGDGLAAMAAISERTDVRLLRPLLDVPRGRLTATLAAAGQTWIDDPGNDNTDMARGRLRSAGSELPLADALATAQTSARERISGERAMATLAARALRFHPAGFAAADRTVLAEAAPDIVERLLARTVMAVAGRAYPPRGARTQRLREAVTGTGPLSGRTLGGCRVLGQGELIYVCREAAQIGPPVRLIEGTTTLWDNRFAVSVTKNLGEEARLGALTAPGWAQIVAVDSRLRCTSLPYAARTVMPAVWCADKVLTVPHLGFVNDGKGLVTAGLRLNWQPGSAVAPAAFGAAFGKV